MNTSDYLTQQIQFLVESEKLKFILRRTSPVKSDRRENSAEHSWSLALMAIVLAGHANQPLNLLRVLKMVLIHDIVEIDAGDTDAFDTAGNGTKTAAGGGAFGRGRHRRVAAGTGTKERKRELSFSS